jgi:hypothetical protein
MLIFLSLVYLLVSMLVFLTFFVARLGLYFGSSEGEPLDRVVLAMLSAATVLAIALTCVGLNLLISLVVTAAVIGV